MEINDIYNTYIDGNITIAIREYKKLNERDSLSFISLMNKEERERFIAQII